MNDVVPELFKKLKKDFQDRYSKSKKIKTAIAHMKDGTATHKDSNAFAEEVGDILAAVFRDNLSADKFPEGKVYYNIAERILGDTLGQNHKLISEFGRDVQTQLNLEAGLKIKGKAPKMNKERVDNLVDKISGHDFEEVSWAFDEPVVNFSQSVVDQLIIDNADLHNKLGLKPKIVREQAGNCCDWCANLVGEYAYPNVPEDVYKRHRYCRCTIDYYPGDGRRQDAITKKWEEPERDLKIANRKEYKKK